MCWKYSICRPEDYIGVDVSTGLLKDVLERTSGRAHVIDAVAEELKLPDRSVDFVVCSECFEHLPDPALALHEFYRVLKVGGRILFSRPMLCGCGT
jgi:ubiquinone/menaquinone biosynthesis C-methylase UbiE